MDGPIGALSLREMGGKLIRDKAALDAAEAKWLELLAEFDSKGGYVIDGHHSCVSWLVDKCGLARSSAHERLRVAHELRRRPVLGHALAEGSVSYAKVRVLTRMTGLGDDSDHMFLTAMAKGTVADAEQLYRRYKLLQEQEKVPRDTRWDRCGVQTVGRSGGVATMELRLPEEGEQRLLAILDLMVRGPVEKSPVETYPQPPQLTWTQRRVHALLDLLEAGLAYYQANVDVDVEAAVVNVICDYDTLINNAPGSAELDGGYPVSGETARRLACDAGLIRIITRGASEVLDIGRKTRHWNKAQRRAIRFRWCGRCAFPGCGRRITQIHHCKPWQPGGETNLDCGVPVCSYHHHLVHEGGWTVSYDPTMRAAIFTTPDDQQVIAPTPGALTWAA